MRRCFFLLTILACFFSVTVLHASDSTAKKQAQATANVQPPAAQATIMLTLDDLKQAILPEVMEPDKKEWLANELEEFQKEQIDARKKSIGELQTKIDNAITKSDNLADFSGHLIDVTALVITLFAAAVAFAFYNVFEKSKQEISKIQKFYEAGLKTTRETLKTESQAAINELKEMTENELSNQQERLEESKKLQHEVTAILNQQVNLLTSDPTPDDKPSIPGETEEQEKRSSALRNDVLNDPDSPISLKLLVQAVKLYNEDFYEQAYEIACKAIEKNEEPNDTIYYKISALIAFDTIENTERLSKKRKIELYKHITKLYPEAQEHGFNMEAIDFKILADTYKNLFLLNTTDDKQELIKLATTAYSQCLTAPVTEGHERPRIAHQIFELYNQIKDPSHLLTIAKQDIENAIELEKENDGDRFMLGYIYYILAHYSEENEGNALIKKAIPLLEIEPDIIGHYVFGRCYATLGDLTRARHHFEAISSSDQIVSKSEIMNDEFLKEIVDESWFQSIVEQYAPEDEIEDAS